jgi:hypothetical protein
MGTDPRATRASLRLDVMLEGLEEMLKAEQSTGGKSSTA